MALNNTVNNILSKMHNQSIASDKGSYGEEAVFAICESIYQECSGSLIHSYTYKTVPSLSGNIKRSGNDLYVENTGSLTEIDIMLITPFKIFPIEVKAYKANTITLTNDKISGCSFTDKSPVHQNEMHMRHLYPQIYTAVPNGMTEYIIPIVVFADKTKVIDNRTVDNKNYIKVTILNQLNTLIREHNKPYNNTLLDVASIEMKLRGTMLKNEKFLPYIPKKKK